MSWFMTSLGSKRRLKIVKKLSQQKQSVFIDDNNTWSKFSISPFRRSDLIRILSVSEAYSEPCRICKTERFAKTVKAVNHYCRALHLRFY